MLTLTDLGLTGVPVVAAGLAGGLAVLRPPGPRVTSGLQHFAAGVVFAAAAIDLLPPVLQRDPVVAIAGFAVGLVVLFAMRAFTERLQRRQQATCSFPAGMVGAVGIDFAVDGLVLGAGFAVGGNTGLLLAVAITVEYLFVGLSMSSTLGRHASRRLVAGLPPGLALLTVAGAVVGATVLDGVSARTLAGVLAFGAVAFMYLVVEELLVAAHEQGETATGSALFFVGFLLYLVLTETLG
jgi:ZIP family zinc transporter